MAKRGRKKRPSESRLPPRGFYRSLVSSLFAVRPDGQQVGDKAFRLWHIVSAYNWDGSECDLTDEELKALIGVRRRQTVVELRGELRAAGLLREHFPSGGRRLLEPLGLGLVWGTAAPSRPTAVAGDDRAGISVRSTAQERCTLQRTQIPEEEEDLYPDSKISPHPPGSRLGGGGVGGDELVSAVPDTNSAAIAAALERRGVFPEPAARIGELMATAGLGVERAVEVFLAQMEDTAGSLPLTVWRLKRGLWEPSADAEARAAKYARQSSSGPEEGELGPGHRGARRPVGPKPDASVDARVTWSQTAAEVWEAALGELELELARATFDTWLRGACLVAHEDGAFVVGVANEYAVEWLTNRLSSVVLRVLRHLAGQEGVSVRFVVAGGESEGVEGG